jgi:NlpC/P60 family
MRIAMPSTTIVTRALVFAAIVCAAAWCGVASAEDHLTAARDLVTHVDLANTNYEHGQGSVTWSGTPASHTDCSGLVDQLLMHSYGYTPDDFKRWFDSHRPSAKRYYDAIVEQKGFVHLAHVTDLKPGDFIAVKYLTRTDDTGHIMLVDQAPMRAPMTRSDSHGEAWLVTVIDSAESGHGPTDTRHKAGANGRDHDGIGRGVLRLYADGDGHVAGFSWSALANSKFQGPDDEPVALGRLVANFKP